MSLRAAVAMFCLGTLGGWPLPAQGVRWVGDSKQSLAWWQIDPHYEHLWATTCPDDPSWQPGEGRDPGLYTDYSTRPTTVAAARSDSRIPLFPRHRVRPLCREAVRVEVTLEDTVRWRGVKGVVVVTADSLFTGLSMRDIYARKAVLETERYPEIKFTIDSLTNVQRGDTLRALAVGTFETHGRTLPASVPIVAWRDAAGFRVKGQSQFDAQLLVSHFDMSKWALGMGVVFKRWKTVHWGVDLIVRPDASRPGPT